MPHKFPDSFSLIKLKRGSSIPYNLIKRAAGLEEQLTFTSFVPYEELPRCYAMTDAVIVPPEIYESFSYTAAQAIACGKKVIASDSGGMPETLSNGKHGLIFLKADHSSLTKEMETSLNKNISTEELKRFAQNSYSIESLREKFLSFYNII